MQFVDVPEHWIAKAKALGDLREDLNKHTGNTPAYAHSGRMPYSSRTASRLAVLAEVAAHLWLDVDPMDTVFVVEPSKANYEALRAKADLTVGDWQIEVRNASRALAPLPIKAKDNAPNKVVLQALVQMKDKRPTGRVYFLGWRMGSDYTPRLAKAGTDYRHKKHDINRLKERLAA